MPARSPNSHAHPRRRPAPRPRPRPRRRVGLRLAAVLSALVLTASGVGHAVVTSVNEGVRRVDPFRGMADRDRPDAGNGQNVLLIGTDSREGLSEAERRAYHLGDDSCHCADAIMLLHLSADGERASLVSLPRDSYARLPAHDFAATGEHHDAHPDKLNAALAHGGPSLMVRTVEDLTDLRVDHYLEVDFASFVRAVDVVGGVPVCTSRPLRDEYAGLDLPAGTTTLDGATALAYVRARHLDVSSDLGRMKRQQRFLAAFLDRAASSEVLLNPARLSGTASTLLASVRADPGLGAEDILALARAVRDIGSSGTEFTSVPVADAGREVAGIGSTVTWDEPGAERVFEAVREDRPLTTGDSGREKAPAEPGKDPCP